MASFFVDDKVVALSGDHAHEIGTILQVVNLVYSRTSDRRLYKVRFAKGTRWYHHSALRAAYKHEVRND